MFDEMFPFRQLVKEADPTVFGSCVFGNTCLDHMVAFACYGDTAAEDNLYITAMSFVTPLWPGRPVSDAYVQAVPPTPEP